MLCTKFNKHLWLFSVLPLKIATEKWNVLPHQKKGEKTKSEGKLEFFDTKLLYTKNALLVRIKIFFGSYLRHIFDSSTVFENYRKSLIQYCERSELRLHFWVDKSWLKIPKMVHFGEFLKIWSLRSNSVTRQVGFNRTKIGEKCQN